MKKIISISFIYLVVVFSSIVYPSNILYKDYTGLHSQLICCNSSQCITYSDYMTHNISGWESSNNPLICYEVKNIYKEIDIYSSLMNNVSFIFTIIILFIVIGFVLKWLLSKK